MSGRYPRTSNLGLPALPSDDDFVAAVRAVVDDHRQSRAIARQFQGASANEVAHMLRIVGAHRMGNGAVQGSWTGTMSAALRVAPRLAALTQAGHLERRWTRDNCRGRWEYFARDDRWKS